VQDQEALANKDVRKTSADSLLASFRELPKCTADAAMEWQLFKAAAASSAARLRGRMRLGVASNTEKVSSWWNQEVKDACRAKEVANNAWLQNEAERYLHSR